MKNNKGYTLVELLLTLLIFSVIMVSIIAIMRTSLVSYRNGLAETKIQEDAQIVINQMSNILVDASSFTADASGDAVKWPMTFTHPTYGTVKINYNSATGELSMNDDLLANNVKNFDVLELHKTDDLTTKPVDNSAVITLTLDDGNGGHEYTVQKVVFFRNNVENEENLMYDVSNTDDPPTPTPTVSGNKAAVLRFGEVDVTKQFGIVKDAALSTTATLYYELKGSKTAVANTTDEGIRIICKSNLLSNFNTKVEAKDATESGSAYITGKDKNNNTVTVILYTERVEFDDSVGIIEMKATETNNNGVHTSVPVKGIDMNAVGGTDPRLSVTYDAVLTKGGSTWASYSGKTLSRASSASIGHVSHDLTNGGEQILIGLCSDVNSNGLMISTGNDAIGGKAPSLNNSDGNQKLKFTIHISAKTSSGASSFTPVADYTIEYYYYLMGNSIKNAS